MGAARVRDSIVPPLTAEELARAIRWAKEWYRHEKQPDSLATAFAAQLFDAAAEDFAHAEQGSPVRRSVFAIRDIDALAKTLPERARAPTTSHGVPATIGGNLETFRHYYRLGRQWYRFTFVGPNVARRAPDAGPQPHANYYLAVEYERVSATAVPVDRRHHRPGHLVRWSRQGRPASMAGAPFPSPDLTGRRKELYEALRTIARTDGAVISVQGLPGVGKTEFVAALADRITGKFGDGVVYLQLSNGGVRETSANLLRQAIAALAPDAVPASSDPELAAQFRTLARSCRCAIICEDALSAEDVVPFLPHRGSALIVTSRARLSLAGAPHPRVLQTFPPEVSARFLRDLAGAVDIAASAALVDATRAEVAILSDRRILTVSDVIAALSGDLPLALRISGQYLAQHPDIEPHAFAHRFLDAHERLRLQGSRAETRSVEASVAVSYDALTEEESGAFRRLGIFASSFERIAALMVTHDPAPLADAGAATIVSELVQHGLVRFDRHNRRYSLHELLRAYAKTRLTANERTEALNDVISYYHYFAGTQMLAMRKGDTSQSIATESTFDEELPNVIAVVQALLAADEVSRDDRYFASDIVLGLAPFLLRSAAERLLGWSERLLGAFMPLAEKNVRHVQPTPAARAHVHSDVDWGNAGIRLLHHAYLCGLALETSSDPSAEKKAIGYYGGMRRVREELGLADPRSGQLVMWAWTRLARLVRRGAYSPKEIADLAMLRTLQGEELGALDGLLTDLVRAQACAADGSEEALEIARESLAFWAAHRVPVPWAGALLLDALSEHAPAWFWACHIHVVQEGQRVRLTMLDHLLQLSTATERPVDATLEDVTRHFRMQPLDHVRTPYPLAMGAALVALGLSCEALVFYDAAVRVAEWVCDTQGLLVALETRARANEGLGQHDRAADDWERLLRLHAKSEWEAARDQARVRADAAPGERGSTGGPTKRKHRPRDP